MPKRAEHDQGPNVRVNIRYNSTNQYRQGLANFAVTFNGDAILHQTHCGVPIVLAGVQLIAPQQLPGSIRMF